MFVYVYWPKSGVHTVQGFHKIDKAARFVIDQIDAYCNIPNPFPKKIKKAAYLRARGAPQPAHRNIYGNLPQPVFGGGAFDLAPPILVEQPLINHAVEETKTTQPKEENITPELTKLREHLSIAKKKMTFDNAVKAIELYEEYNKYVLGQESALHSLQDIKIVD